MPRCELGSDRALQGPFSRRSPLSPSPSPSFLFLSQDVFNFDDAIDKLSATLPVPLTETFFLRCKRKELVTAVVALGSAWSTTNLLGSLFWAVCGYAAILALKRIHRDSPTTVVSRHTKAELGELFQEMKDEALVEVLSSLRGTASLPEETFQRFCRLHQRGTDEDQLTLGAELSERANQCASRKDHQLKEKFQKFQAEVGRFSSAVASAKYPPQQPQPPERDSRRLSISLASHPLGVTSNPLSTATAPHARRFSFQRRGSAPELFHSQQL